MLCWIDGNPQRATRAEKYLIIKKENIPSFIKELFNKGEELKSTLKNGKTKIVVAVYQVDKNTDIPRLIRNYVKKKGSKWWNLKNMIKLKL